MGQAVKHVKYGRIFTEDDVRSLIESVVDSYDPDIVIEEIIEGFEGKFPKDEPTFVLRAQDGRALGAIRHYYDHQNPKASQQHLDNIQDSLIQFAQFRHNHPDRVREPD